MYFGAKRKKVARDLRKLHDVELHDLYSSSHIIIMNKSRMRWARYMARVERKRNAYRVLSGKPEVKYHLVELGLDGRIIVQLILSK